MIFIFLLFYLSATAQGFLHVEGKYIYNGEGEEVIIRGLGTGNWMLQEGYMMQTADLGGTQHAFRNRLIETIGEAKTDSFYNAWLQYHFTKTDVDSMRSWGFNAVRVAMHYKWFTPPIEEEPVEGEITWIRKGFDILDSLLGWCEDNQMYLILDLHGAPGGQGKDSNISDYDPSKPSLWESELNKAKTVALWRKLAERYANERWIGGYDLINETNWTFPEGNNSQLRDLYERITDTIRAVDSNHILFIEGNAFANDFSGLTPPWDDNMVYSFHKYWNYNTPNALDWVLSMRDTYNIPVWLGETGENSNTWFTNLVALCEQHHVGWSFWPVKKPGINNPLRVIVNDSYSRLLDFWRGEGPELTEDEAFQAVLQFAENHKIENCIFQKDVVDAMIRQPHTTATLPFKEHKIGERIYFADYDLGRVKYAYYDNDTANYHLNQDGEYTNWNQGWSYRNDGVDIEACSDETGHTNGYNVGWTEDGEWMQYTVTSDSAVAGQFNIRYASNQSGAKVHLEIDGIPVTKNISLPSTGGWQNWETIHINDVIIPQGTINFKFVINSGGVNLNYFSFMNPQMIDNAECKALMAFVDFPGDIVTLVVNKEITTALDEYTISDFNIESGNGKVYTINNIVTDPSNGRILKLSIDDFIGYEEDVLISYNGTSVMAGQDILKPFSRMVSVNYLPQIFNIPGKIEAEDFLINNGFQLENCQDTGGGQNTGYANPGDFVEFAINVEKENDFKVEYRVATPRSDAKLVFQVAKEDGFVNLDTITFDATGGWQNWETQSGKVTLPAGRYKIRLKTLHSEYNLNWFRLSVVSSVLDIGYETEISIYPNPAKNFLKLHLPFTQGEDVILQAYNNNGQLVKKWDEKCIHQLLIDISDLKSGFYLLLALADNKYGIGKFFVN
ncbi:MAG: endoglucanase [Anaerophaga sp.]|nr:endoglucanase [Anaerophaga sp.]